MYVQLTFWNKANVLEIKYTKYPFPLYGELLFRHQKFSIISPSFHIAHIVIINDIFELIELNIFKVIGWLIIIMSFLILELSSIFIEINQFLWKMKKLYLIKIKKVLIIGICYQQCVKSGIVKSLGII